MTPEHCIWPDAPAVLEDGDGGVEDARWRLGLAGVVEFDGDVVSSVEIDGLLGVVVATMVSGVDGAEGYGLANTGLGKLGTEFGRDGGEPVV